MQHWKTALLSCLITINLATVSSFFVVFFCAQLSHNLSDNNNVSSSFFYLVYIDWVHPFSWSIVVMIHSLKHVDCVNVCSRAPTHTVKTRHWCSIHLIKSMAKNYCLSFPFDWFYFFFSATVSGKMGKKGGPPPVKWHLRVTTGPAKKKTNISAENCEILLPFCDLVSVYRTPTRW